MRPKIQDDHRKAKQLCAQIQRTLDSCINEYLENEQAVRVVDVLPAPNTSHLMVVVEPLDQIPLEEYAEVVATLSTNEGRFRSEIARDINRKKTPGLSFTMQPARVT